MKRLALVLLSVALVLIWITASFANPNDEQLYYAVMGMDGMGVEQALKDGANANYETQGRSILGWAAVTGDSDIIRLLLSAGAKPDAVDKGGLSPLMLAIIGQHEKAVEAIVAAKPNLKQLYPQGKTIAMLAVESGKVAIVKSLLAAGADFNAADSEGNTPALDAVQSIGDADTMFAIITLMGEYKVDFNHSNAAYTALYYAAIQENVQLVDSLLKAGADHSARTKDGGAPLIAGLRNNEIFKNLLAAGASPDTRDSMGQPVLFRAIEERNVEAVKALIAAGVNINAEDRSKRPALQFAKDMMADDIVTLLQQHIGQGTTAASGNDKPSKVQVMAGKKAPRSEYDALPKIQVMQEMAAVGSDVSYFSAASVREITDFYKKELPKKGWAVGGIETDEENYAVLRVTRSNDQLSVSLGLGTDHVPPRVLVTLTPHGTLKVPALPRYPGSTPLFEQDTIAIYVTGDPLPKVTRETAALLQAQGWKGKQVAQTDTMRHMAYTKGKSQLTVMISVAPAQNNNTTIQYSLQLQ